MNEDPVKLPATRAEQYPRPTGLDVAEGAARAALAAIPVVGGTITETLSLILTPAVARRRDEWFKDLANGLDELQGKVEGFESQRLADREEFVSATIQATRAAISTHNREKREALRNALLNIALERAPDEDTQTMFLSYIDDLTAWHLRILSFFGNPTRYATEAARETRVDRGAPNFYMGSPAQVLELMFPELKGQRALYDQIVKDLFARGLFGTESLHAMMTSQGALSKRTTDRGDQFLAFIGSPLL